MKINVINQIGKEVNSYPYNTGHSQYPSMEWDDFEQYVKSYPAPGIHDGEHECELVWQFSIGARWYDCNHVSHEQAEIEYNVPTRQIYRVCPVKEQGEISGVRTAEEMIELHNGSALGAMYDYAERIAEAVRSECLKQTIRHPDPFEIYKLISEINISDFLK